MSFCCACRNTKRPIWKGGRHPQSSSLTWDTQTIPWLGGQLSNMLEINEVPDPYLRPQADYIKESLDAGHAVVQLQGTSGRLITCDVDNLERPPTALEYIGTGALNILPYFYSTRSVGNNRHEYLVLDSPTTRKLAGYFAASLGSDPRREHFSSLRLDRGEESAYLMLERLDKVEGLIRFLKYHEVFHEVRIYTPDNRGPF